MINFNKCSLQKNGKSKKNMNHIILIELQCCILLKPFSQVNWFQLMLNVIVNHSYFTIVKYIII